MALRSLNSIVPDRKKNSSLVTKKSRPIAITIPPGANDENVDLLGSPNRMPPRNNNNAPAALASCKQVAVSPPSPAAAPAPAPAPPPSEEPPSEIEYIPSGDLRPLDHVDSHIITLLEELNCNNWLKVCEAINSLRRLCIHHTTSLAPLLEKAVPLLIKAMKNPRSALCKTAIMASADLFKAYGDTMLPMLEPLLLQLLLKASQDKRFVCEEAERSLEEMTAWLSPSPLMAQLQPYVAHRNPRVRAKAASCVYRSVSKLGPEGINEYGFQPLLQIAGSQVNDQLPEARDSARKLVATLHAAFSQQLAATALQVESQAAESDDGDNNDWYKFCNNQLSSHVAQAIIRLTN